MKNVSVFFVFDIEFLNMIKIKNWLIITKLRNLLDRRVRKQRTIR